MKKYLYLSISILLCLSLSGCGGGSNNAGSDAYLIQLDKGKQIIVTKLPVARTGFIAEYKNTLTLEGAVTEEGIAYSFDKVEGKNIVLSKRMWHKLIEPMPQTLYDSTEPITLSMQGYNSDRAVLYIEGVAIKLLAVSPDELRVKVMR